MDDEVIFTITYTNGETEEITGYAFDDVALEDGCITFETAHTTVLIPMTSVRKVEGKRASA